MRRVIFPVLAASLVISPIAASAAERIPAATSDAEELSGSPWLWILLTAAAVGLLIVLVSNDDEPVSP
jgi:hypothetical protein